MTLFDLLIYGAQPIPDNIQIVTFGDIRRQQYMEVETPSTPDTKETTRKRRLSINEENVSKKHISSTKTL
jgi:hypothetical protein